MKRYLLILLMTLLAAPLGAFLLTIIGRGVEGDLAIERAHQVWWGALWILIAVCTLVTAFVLIAQAVSRRRDSLARYFPVLVYCTLFILLMVLVAQGLLLLWATVNFGFISRTLYVPGVLIAISGGLLFAAFLIVERWREYLAVEPVTVTGVVIDSGKLPELMERVERIAQQLGTQRPGQLILGLEPFVFVTLAPVNLRGAGVLSSTTTLYLPLFALRALSEKEIDAVVAHELAHLRGADLEFSRRFLPAFRSLEISLENLQNDEEENPWLHLGRMPAISALEAMLFVLRRAVYRIGRERELEADRASIELGSSDALISALFKITIAARQWDTFKRNSAALVQSGVRRHNLINDYILRTKRLLERADRSLLIADLLAEKLSHPFDTHPTLAERGEALSIDVAAVIEGSFNEMMSMAAAEGSPYQALEESVTAAEVEQVRVPGMKLTLSAHPSLPDLLDVPNASGPLDVFRQRGATR